MKLQFDSSQNYQLQAVQSVVSLFEGQPLAKSDFEISFATGKGSTVFNEKGIANNLILNHEQILKNVQAVQSQNVIKQSDSLVPSLLDDKKSISCALNFTIEMETGTGKTYTFIRTIYELNKVYGFKKFVIVVPSVAIREGTLKNLQITHEHFQSLYGHQPINYVVYDRSNLVSLRNFAMSNNIQILVINVDSFTKDNNVINTTRETGIKPIEFIQAVKPIVIIDEPQNFETDVRKSAIANLNPLCTLRYSATHRNLYNLVYSLSPIQAYDLGLVKQIEVDGIVQNNDSNVAYIKLIGFEQAKRSIKAILNIHILTLFDIKEKKIKVSVGDDLFNFSGSRDVYKDRYIVNSISMLEERIEFSNGIILKINEEVGRKSNDIIKYQIERTIYHHFEKEYRYWSKLGIGNYEPIKVISLFFIDKVANYRDYDENGYIKGRFAIWFEEIFKKYAETYRPLYRNLFDSAPPDSYFAEKFVHASDIPQLQDKYWDLSSVHNGYFSADKKGRLKDTKGSTKDDEDIYTLIMKDKERLLNMDEPLRFIFSHSALREGWDNPNVFQICTLNESKSDIKKRQEIGRGLRLPVDSQGQRVQDKRINILTVIANESYEDFSKALQLEIQDETSVDFKGRIKNAREKTKIKINKELTIENYPLLFEIWEKISRKTRYSVNYSTDDLIRRSVLEVGSMPRTKRPVLESKTARLKYSEEGIDNKLLDISTKNVEELRYSIPDVYSYIQGKIDITRSTIYQILIQSNRYDELEVNPQMFLDNVINCIRQTLNTLLVEGVRYEEINGKYYEMTLFKHEEIETYLSNLFEVSKKDKTVLDYILVDSDIESDFARDCEADENIKFFFKLPRGFKVPTPIGNYIPDWAIIFENDSRIYFVAETKSNLNRQLLRDIERMKIDCGEKHFALFKPLGVEYKLAVTTKDLY